MATQSPRFNLASLDFLETDSEKILSEILNEYTSITGRTLAQGDPVRLFIEAIAARMTQLSEAFNIAAKNNLLSYATGDYLDALGAYVNTPRLEALGASTTIKFTLNTTVADSVYQIPQGTLVSDGSITFATDNIAFISIGQNSVEVTATAIYKGAYGNGLAIGTIKNLIEPLPNIERVENINISSGGADIEDDESYAERIRLAPASFSVAGPHDAYEYHVYKFSGAIIDVSVYGLTEFPGNVYIHPLLTGGQLPNESFLKQLSDYISADTLRPLTDHVLVSAPEAVNYEINLKWFLDDTQTPRIEQIKQQVSNAVEEYRLWQQSKIGRDIIPDELIKLIIQAGAKRVEIITPIYTAIKLSQVAQCSDVQVSFGGVEK